MMTMCRPLASLGPVLVCLCLALSLLPAACLSAEAGDRRITRSRYKMGYMFGKRSSREGSTAGLLIKTLTGKALSVEDLSSALQSDPALAQRAARHLDINGDGYVAVSELL